MGFRLVFDVDPMVLRLIFCLDPMVFSLVFMGHCLTCMQFSGMRWYCVALVGLLEKTELPFCALVHEEVL